MAHSMDYLLDEAIDQPKQYNDYYKIVIADDEEEVHRVTKLILKSFTFGGKALKFIDAYSGEESIKLLEQHPDTAVIFLDVVMETEDAGLKVVKHLRETLLNETTRVVLRTGHPGEAPEDEIIRNYDINDYRLKTELTVKRLNTTLYAALRNYRDLQKLEHHKRGLERIIQASSHMFENNSLKEFLETILNELSNFSSEQIDMVYLKGEEQVSDGLVIAQQKEKNIIIAATGKYKDLVDSEIGHVEDLSHINEWFDKKSHETNSVQTLGKGFIIESIGKSSSKNYIYFEGREKELDFQLINLFLSNFSIALDNFILNNVLQTTQKEFVYALAETVESHFEETGSHIFRISEMMYQFALIMKYSYAESEMLKLASTMHDLGKVSIPDRILKKPARLTEDEFEVMKTHAFHGYRILKNQETPVMKLAGEIALNHHEKYDGSGYPNGLKGLEIPVSARMMAIVDVYDAMSHKRIYKDAISKNETLEYLITQKSKHFDPDLVNLFIKNLDTILSSARKDN
jgi:response regulator RpfG family c-di-GMP phosphodiesterase